MHWSLTTPFSAVELLAMLVLWVAALATPPSLRLRLGRAVVGAVRALSRRPLLGLGVLSLGWNLFPLLFYWPIPSAHDEFSYLLMADTFLDGRLANPAHPMWRSFETFHVLQHPTYASKYPPFQGCVLAFGRALLGDPSLGVKSVGALASLAVWWALRGFLTRFWATVGALVFAIQFGGFSYWSQSLFGGAASALGGALVLGAVPRLEARAGVASSLALGAGLAILAMSRPYEGLLLAVPCLGYLAWKGRGQGVRFFLRLAPAALVAGAGLAGLGYYNQAVTGSATTFPYQLYTARYGYAKPFRFQTPQYDVVLDDEVMERFVETFEKRRYRISFAEHWRPMLRFYAAPLLLVPLVLLPWLTRHRRSRLPMTLAAIAAAGLALTTFILPHYAAPFSALLVLLLVQCLRLLRTKGRRRRSRVGSYLFGTVVTAWLLGWATFSVASALAQTGFGRPGGWPSERLRIERELQSEAGRHLVFVRYGNTHSVHEEWVYNRADIDGARIVWARELGTAQDALVDRYFCGRDVWRVEPDTEGGTRLRKLRPPLCEPAG